jgi:hypothetical protein
VLSCLDDAGLRREFDAHADLAALAASAEDKGEQGRLNWGVGDEVVVGEAFTVAVKDWGRREKKTELSKETEGKVLEINAEGAAKIAFREPVSKEHWVPKDQFYRLSPLPNALDTPIQRRLKQARLRRCEVRALVLYTGPMFVLYNALYNALCAALASAARWRRASSLRRTSFGRSGRRSTSTRGSSAAAKSLRTRSTLASVMKKPQGLAAKEPSSRLYRCLDGREVAKFIASCGFTDLGFMSTTKDQRIALQYSGVNKGLVGTIFCI